VEGNTERSREVSFDPIRVVAPAVTFLVDDLPDLLRFDGTMAGDGRDFLQFTELDDQSASYGASFYVDSRAAILDAILSRREEKRIQFAAGATPVLENGVAQ
jgi:hypothetical protein